MAERATELEYLRWFHCNADFGPADGDVRYYMDEEFKKETGKELPEGYSDDREEEYHGFTKTQSTAAAS